MMGEPSKLTVIRKAAALARARPTLLLELGQRKARGIIALEDPQGNQKKKKVFNLYSRGARISLHGMMHGRMQCPKK
jgi:hypothetical protein